MQERQSFEYAIIRVVPQVEREEFLNVGVVLYCRQQRFLQMKFYLDRDRLRSLNPGADPDEIRLHLEAFEKICLGKEDGGPIAALDAASRFRWLTATRSTCIQTSDVHPGLSGNPAETLEKLFGDLVLLKEP